MSENLVSDQDPPNDTVNEEQQEKDANSKVTEQQTTDDSDEEWRTPESEKNKIPAIEDCPPAPEKPRKMRPGTVDSPAPEMEFFENKGREEVEMFFDSCMENSGVAANGRFSLKKRLFDNSSSVNDKKA